MFTHLVLTTGAGKAGELRIDELIVRDTALGLPEVGDVARPRPPARK